MTTLNHCHIIYTSYQIFLLKIGESETEINWFFSNNSFSSIVEAIENQNDFKEEIYDNQEKTLKASLKNFVDNCKMIIEGKDTLSFVLNMKSEESLYSLLSTTFLFLSFIFHTSLMFILMILY